MVDFAPREIRRRRTRAEMARPLTDEQRDLAGRYYPLAMSIARRFGRQFAVRHRDAICSAACLGLMHAACNFDRTRGLGFASYASMVVDGSIRTQLTTERRKERMANTVGEWSDSPDRRDDLALLADIDHARGLLAGLPPRYRCVLGLAVMQGMAQSEVATRMGTSTMSVCRDVAKAIRLLVPSA